jgi:hypothetical protein
MLYIAGLRSFPRDRLVLFAVLAAGAGCSSGTRPSIDQIADGGGLSNGPCDVVLKCTPDMYGVCQHTCTPDPGPRTVNCAQAEQNFEFYDPPLWTFEELAQGLGPQDEVHARGMYSYTDNSTFIKTFTTEPDPGSTLRKLKTWEPRTALMPRCSDKVESNNRAIHIQGGPFLSWGGGVGIGLKNFPSVVGSVGVADAMKDISGYEGISFWARRGPDSQAGFRVLVGDKYTDDDIAYLMYRDDPTQTRFCERVRECGCLNHRSCVAVHLDRDNGGTGDPQNLRIPEGCHRDKNHISADTQVMKFCGTPEEIAGAESTSTGGSACNICAETMCNDRWPAFPDDQASPSAPLGTDRAFYGKPCSPYTMRNGNFGYWCFDPAAGERPAEPSEQCGDHWTRVVNLSTEWQFYTVPFSAMAQQGWAKRSAGLDLTSMSVVRFTWDGGFIDFWIDDVRFYKTKPPQPPQP